MKSKLIKSRGHRCEICNLTDWLEKPIPLEVHHIDGQSNDEGNLQLLCCNCHAQTPNYRGKGIRTAKNINDDEVVEAAGISKNIRQLLQALDLVAKGGNYAVIRKRLSRLGLDGLFKREPKYKVCPACGQEFVGKKFCSQNCSNSYNANGHKTRRTIRPSQEILARMIKTMGYCATGRAFGVSDNAIRKWLNAPIDQLVGVPSLKTTS